MAESKGWGSRFVRLFVEQEGGATAAPDAPEPPAVDPMLSDAELIARYAEAPAPASPPSGGGQPAAQGAVPSGDPSDFAAVYTAAGIDEVQRDRLAKARELLRNLPVETPMAVQKTIVEASLRAFGFPVESILAGGQAEIAALEAHVADGKTATEQLLGEGQTRLTELSAEIDQVRKIMEDAVNGQSLRARTCDEERRAIATVLGFFGPGK